MLSEPITGGTIVLAILSATAALGVLVWLDRFYRTCIYIEAGLQAYRTMMEGAWYPSRGGVLWKIFSLALYPVFQWPIALIARKRAFAFSQDGYVCILIRSLRGLDENEPCTSTAGEAIAEILSEESFESDFSLYGYSEGNALPADLETLVDDRVPTTIRDETSQFIMIKLAKRGKYHG